MENGDREFFLSNFKELKDKIEDFLNSGYTEIATQEFVDWIEDIKQANIQFQNKYQFNVESSTP